jgi:hypothetical protein
VLKLKWALGAAVLLAALGLGRAADDDAFDLRGPAPQKGQEFVSKRALAIKDADAVMKSGTETVKFKLTLLAALEEEVTVVEVTGRDVTKYRTKIVRDRVEMSGLEKDVIHTETSVLEKETVLSTRDGKKWQHALVDTRPTEKQTKELAERSGIENGDGLYPAEKVKVGHAWTADALGINKALGDSLSDIKGKLDQKFVKVEDLDGEKVAVIESAGKVTGKMKDAGAQTLDATIELKLTTWKSLRTGTGVRARLEGKIELAGTVKEGDTKTDVTISGPISSESTTKLVEKKK